MATVAAPEPALHQKNICSIFYPRTMADGAERGETAMSGAAGLFPKPTEVQRQALAIAGHYLERAATQASSCLIAWHPGHQETDLLHEFRHQLQESASVCAMMLEVFNAWPE
jgi:hypothetical protein